MQSCNLCSSLIHFLLPGSHNSLLSSPAVHEGRPIATPAFLWPTWHRQDEHHPGLCQDALLCKRIQLHGVRGVYGLLLDVTFDP